MLILPIKRKWFDMIKSGVKTEEYREIKPYYDRRFRHLFGKDFLVKFRNGYSNNAPYIICKCALSKGFGNPEWGAPKNECYILKIKEILEVKDNENFR